MLMILVHCRWPCWCSGLGIAQWILVLALLAIPDAASLARAKQAEAEVVSGQRWALILVGIPGDESHAKLFRATADAWQMWLTDSLEVPRDHVLRLPGEAAQALTADAIRAAVDELKTKLKPEDSLWVFTLGHGNYDGKQAWFHVAGKDPSAEDFGRWFSEVRCREQVIWLTQQNSGWFVKPLSRPGRIVIAATAADDESNETEFPHALATVLQSPAEQLDTDRDEKVSVAELFTAVTREVERRFQQDKRLPTEHAQLDDNGDGQGAEDLFPKENEAAPAAKIDGALAKKVFVPFRSLKPAEKSNSSSVREK